MKKIGWQIAFMILLISFSNKTYSQPVFPDVDSVINFLEGDWTWIHSYGSIGGKHMYPSSVGYQIRLVLSKSDSIENSMTYKYFKNDLLDSVGICSIYYSTQAFYPWNINGLPFGITDQSVKFWNKDSINFNDNCMDCYYHTYARNKNTTNIFHFKYNDFSNIIYLFPNPSSNYFEICADLYDKVESVRLMDLNGRIIKIFPANHIGKKYDIKDLPKGFYLVEVQTNTCFIRKILIKI